jgi:hypothetical protein
MPNQMLIQSISNCFFFPSLGQRQYVHTILAGDWYFTAFLLFGFEQLHRSESSVVRTVRAGIQEWDRLLKAGPSSS